MEQALQWVTSPRESIWKKQRQICWSLKASPQIGKKEYDETQDSSEYVIYLILMIIDQQIELNLYHF